jgi:radical SAM-linked protein
VRYRLHFAKDGPLRYSSHLDLARTWERMLRRTGAPLVYSRGFNPRPKMQFAAALPLGLRSTCEIVDIWLHAPQAPPPGDLLVSLRASAPEGLNVLSTESVGPSGPALQTLTHSATYHIHLHNAPPADALCRRVEALLAQRSIPRQRRGKDYDLRPLIHALRVEGDPNDCRLVAVLSLGQAGTGRPDELLDALGLEASQADVTRTEIGLKLKVES